MIAPWILAATGRVPYFALAAGFILVLLMLPLGAQPQAYDGPVFAKGMWRFERSLEISSRNAQMPNTRHLRVAAPVTRCVDPTLAMKETFRPVTIGSCRSTLPEKIKNTYHFAKRCDYLGPVTTTITVESAMAYRETHELTNGPSPKKETVVARRVGDCEGAVNLGTDPTRYNRDDPSSYYPPSPR